MVIGPIVRVVPFTSNAGASDEYGGQDRRNVLLKCAPIRLNYLP